MRIIACIIISIPLFSFFLIYDKKDLFSPRNIYSFIYFLTILLPGMLFYFTNNGIISNKLVKAAVNNDQVYLKYAILQTISYYCVNTGFYIRIIKFNSKKEKINHNDINETKILGILFVIIGLISFIVLMRYVGGMKYFFTHLYLRTILVKGATFSLWFLNFLNIGTLLLIYYTYIKYKKIKIINIILILISGIFCGLGGRTIMVFLVIQSVIMWNYLVKKIKLKNFFKIRFFLTGIVGVLFLNFFVFLRSPEKTKQFLKMPMIFFQQNSIGLLDTLMKESYVKYFMFIIQYFENKNFWYGSTFKGLLTAIIPSAVYRNKPPVDEGMYLYSIAQGREDIFPTMPVGELNGSSYPLETFGSLYVNFGIIGLFLGMILFGYILGKVYRKMIEKNMSFKWLILYSLFLFRFQISVFGIFNMFINYILLSFTEYGLIFCKTKLKKEFYCERRKK